MFKLPSTIAMESIETPARSFLGTGVSTRTRSFLVAGLLLLVVATALRTYHLGNRSLWFDEAVTANTSRGTLPQMLDETRSRLTSPIVYPCILYLVERFGRTAVAVRAPSVLASVLAILVVLAMVRANVSYTAALFSAAILTVTASQIRYAQEVREYSLSVLWAACLIYCLLRWEAAGSRARQPFLLYIAFFLAPLIQFGLVFLALGILSTITLRLICTRNSRFRPLHIAISSISLAAGALLSFVLTLRYQYVSGGRGHWYLATNYFDPKAISLVRFIAMNSRGLLIFVMPSRLTAGLLVLAAVIFCVGHAFEWQFDMVTVLVFTSLSVVICASVANIYPYGGVRQCLFLAPLINVFTGVVFANLVKRLPGSLRPGATIALIALIFFSGYRGMLAQSPYAEYEDTRSILAELDRLSGPHDQVWVNHDAVESVDFYLQGKDRRFVYGKYHGDAPQQYVPELVASIDRHTDRLWLVFSHLQQPSDFAEQQLIVNSLRSDWNIRSVVLPKNAALFVAIRKASAQQAITTP